MSTRGVCGDGGGVGKSTRCSVGGRTGVGGARERQSLGRHWRRRRRRDVMIKERAGAASATERRIVPPPPVHRWSVWRPSVWRRSECAGGVRDIVWRRRRRRRRENEICGKKLSSRLRGSRPLVPDGGRRRQPSAFKYTLYLSQSHTYTHAFLFILSRIWFSFALFPPSSQAISLIGRVSSEPVVRRRTPRKGNWLFDGYSGQKRVQWCVGDGWLGLG